MGILGRTWEDLGVCGSHGCHGKTWGDLGVCMGVTSTLKSVKNVRQIFLSPWWEGEGLYRGVGVPRFREEGGGGASVRKAPLSRTKLL